ncbi:MAG TPA: MFS transporter [Gammaproteobacteria bacterium]|nr:MFS transporter [Gammaproteobacteria bacterium]
MQPRTGTSATRYADYLRLIANPRIAVVLLLGFSSGLPLALSGSTLQAWMATLHVNVSTIAAFSLVGLPYSLKFLWAPVMDRYVPPLLGRRRGWIVITQLILALLLVAMAFTDPVSATWHMGMLAFALAFASASQDIVYNAYFTDLLEPRERGLGAAVQAGGYRLAMIVSGALVLILSDRIGWRASYLLMAVLMLIAMLPAVLGPEPAGQAAAPRSLLGAVIEPLKEMLSRRNIAGLLLLVVLYKFGDWFSGPLTNVFLIEGLHFTATDVGVVNKGFGVAATIVGVFIGGMLMARLRLSQAMLLFGLFQACSILGFLVLSETGHNYPVMVIAVGIENLAWGMGTAAFLAYLMALCDHRYTAFQFALLSALDSISRVLLGPASGLVAQHLGWSTLFITSVLLAIPGLLLLWGLRRRIDAVAAGDPRSPTAY